MKKPEKKSAIIYTRFSPRRNAHECESLDTQFEICTNYSKAQEMEVVGSYEDEALSGANAENRPGLQASIAHAVKTKGVLLFYSLDRLARSTRDALLIAERLDKGGAGLCSVKETFDTTTPMGKCIYTVMSAFNELDRQKISIRTSDAMRRHQQAGRRMSSKGKLCYGWKIDPEDDTRTVKDDYEQSIIDLVIDLRTDGVCEETGEPVLGLSFGEIAKELTTYGYIPRVRMVELHGKTIEQPGKWSRFTIRNIIKRQESTLI